MPANNAPIHAAVSAIVTVGLCATIAACGSAKVSGRRELAAAPTAKPQIVWVEDFDIDVANVKHDPGLLPPPPLPNLPGPLGDLLPPPPGQPKDPKKVAREIVDGMSETLVKELTKKGFRAHRLEPGEPTPTAGWLVRGVFTDVNQGNQLHRALIGFGVGKTDLQVVVDIDDLASGRPESFYEMGTSADSGKAPGAGPLIVLGPAGAAARFVIAGGDLNRNVKQTATQIAMEVAARSNGSRLRGQSRES